MFLRFVPILLLHTLPSHVTFELTGIRQSDVAGQNETTPGAGTPEYVRLNGGLGVGVTSQLRIAKDVYKATTPRSSPPC